MAGAADPALARAVASVLPQTQCRRCGYDDCQAYADAVADGSAAINRCPPGGAEGVARLAALTGRPLLPLDPACGLEGPRRLAVVLEDWCIGCTLCIQACPVDAIAGAPKRMHGVIAEYCTGCELCLPPCPTDCIALLPLPDPALREASAWQAWTPQQAETAAVRYAAHGQRRQRLQRERDDALAAKAAHKQELLLADPGPDATEAARKQAVIAAALERARQRQAQRTDTATSAAASNSR